MKNYLIFSFCLCTFFCQGQNKEGYSLSTGVLIPFSEPDVGEVRGDPYLLEDWKEGSINTETGTFDSLLLRYNIASDVIDYKRGTFILSFAEGALEAFTLATDKGTRQFQFIGADQADKKSRAGYYEVIPITTEASLFIKHKKNLYGADTGAYKMQEDAEYRYLPMLFVMKNDKLAKGKLTDKLCEEQFGLSKEEVEVRLSNLGIILGS